MFQNGDNYRIDDTIVLSFSQKKNLLCLFANFLLFPESLFQILNITFHRYELQNAVEQVFVILPCQQSAVFEDHDIDMIKILGDIIHDTSKNLLLTMKIELYFTSMYIQQNNGWTNKGFCLSAKRGTILINELHNSSSNEAPIRVPMTEPYGMSPFPRNQLDEFP